MTFPEKLKNLRKEKGITQEELANAIFVSRTLISKYENGSVYPTKENAEKIALYFNVNLSDLIDKDDAVQLVLEQSDLTNKVVSIVTIICISISSLFSVLSLIPFLKVPYWDYSNGSPPTRAYDFVSPIEVTMDYNNPIVLITLLTLLANIVLGLLTFKYRNNIWIKLSCYILFVINLFLLFISIVFVASCVTNNYLDF